MKKIIRKTPIYGGDINQSYQVYFEDGATGFLKTKNIKDDTWFLKEVHGLQAIQETNTIPTPKILEQSQDYLLLEMIENKSKNKDYWINLGKGLAAMHKANSSLFCDKKYGFYEDNYFGTTTQINTPNDSWIAFFKENRLAPLFEKTKSYYTFKQFKQIEYLLNHLDQYLVEPEFPSLIHGDLWAGNHMPDAQGNPLLIDPAVYIGHYEVDLALTELFGGFPNEFYQAYNSINPIDTEYSQRRDLYNLYPLLNHLYMFGMSYYYEVSSILDQYTK